MIHLNNEQVKAYYFNDPVIDDMQDYDLYARAAYIQRKINRTDYLVIEYVRKFVANEKDHLSDEGRKYLKEVLDSL